MLEGPLLEHVIVDKISFFRRKHKRKTTVSPSQIFDEGYDGLDELICKNLLNATNKKEREELLNEWWKNRPTGFFATVPLDDGTKLKLALEYRTNIELKTIKYPNIIYLQQDGKTLFILRRPVFYDSGSKHIEVLKRDYRFEVDTSLFDQFPVQRDIACFLPEPLLIPALESFYAEGYPRATPPYKEVKQAGEVFYLRAWMNEPFADAPIDEAIVSKHISFLHSMGVISMRDRRSSHYFVLNEGNEISIINIDPDLTIWVPRLYGNEESRSDDDEYSEKDGEFFSKEDEGRGKIDLGRNADLYREQFETDEAGYLDCLSELHPSSDLNRREKYNQTRSELLQYSEQLSHEFIEKVNEQISP